MPSALSARRRFERRVGAVHQHALRDLERERPRLQAGIVQRCRCTSCIRMGSWKWRAEMFTVICSGRRAWYWPFQVRACSQASLSTHRPSGMINPVSSASGTNRDGGTQPRIGWFHRSSASAPYDFAGHEVHDRLVVNLELLALHRPAQVHLELEVLHHLVMHRRLVHREVPLPPALREVHRQVGVPDHLVGRVAHVQRGDADAHADEHVTATERERSAQRVRDALGDDDHVRHPARRPR